MPHLADVTCDREHVALIFNPVSGMESGEKRRERLRRLAEAADLPCELQETDIREGAAPLARNAVAAGVERVLVYGGDGTVTEAADAIAGSPTSLAVIPGGTGNLLAVNFHIPTDPEAAFEVALSGRPVPVDVGRANGKVFLIMAGIGADARMIHEADREAKRRFGPFAYFRAAWHHLGRPMTRYRITVDGRTFHRRAMTVMVANLGRITGGVPLIPDSDPRDGLLEVAILRTRSFRDVADVIIRALLGRRRNDNLMEVVRGRRIVIQTARPQPVQLDGNEAPATTRLEVWVEPGALQLVCPDTTRATDTVAAVATTVAHMAAIPLWIPLALGWGTAWSAMREKLGSRPARHPWLTGLAVGALTTLYLARRQSPPPPEPEVESEVEE